MPLRGDILRRVCDLVGEEHVSGGDTVFPGTPEEVAAVLRVANEERLGVVPLGSGSQQCYCTPAPKADLYLRLRRLNRIKQYEPGDLTAGMEAGITAAELDAALAQHRQWLPLGVPRPESTTMGGAVATNASGPFRLAYGSARDMVIGMRFATTEGKLVKSGGMVVKNVAGYDMAKLMIGSLGTLAVITGVNVKVFPHPQTETTLLGFGSAAAALEARDALLQSPLQAIAMDLLDSGATALLGAAGLPQGEWLLAIAYGGVEAVIERTRRELRTTCAGTSGAAVLAGDGERRFWRAVCDLPATAAAQPRSARVKVSVTLQGLRALLDRLPAHPARAIAARAASGICYLYSREQELPAFCKEVQRLAVSLDGFAAVEYAPPDVRAQVEAFGARRDNFSMMQKLKQAFDPNAILNPGLFPC